MRAKFSHTRVLRAAALLSVFAGCLYKPSVIPFAMPLTALGPEMAEGQRAAEWWATWAIYGGLAVLAGSFLLNLAKPLLFHRIMQSLALFALIGIIVAFAALKRAGGDSSEARKITATH